MDSLLTTAQHFWPLVVGAAGIVGLVVADDHRRRSLEARHGLLTSFAIASTSSLAIVGAGVGLTALYL